MSRGNLLHPKVQMVLGILRNTGAQVFMASHSATIIASANHGEVLGISRINNVNNATRKWGSLFVKDWGSYRDRCLDIAEVSASIR